jgi:membrane protein DedA with SNARE-associated domain
VSGWVGDVISSFGARGLAALMVLENLFPPIPSEVVLPLAGFLVGRGELGFAEALAASTLGSLVRALALYALGRWAGGASCCATGSSCG